MLRLFSLYVGLFRDWGPGEHAACTRTVTEPGFACVSSTMLREKSVLRLCTIDLLAAARP